MLFNTIPFYAAFICFITIYAVLYQKSRTLMILYVTLISTFFFYNANADLALLLPATALVSWTLTHRMNQTEGRLRKRWLAAIIILDLLPLIYFKYTNFGIDVLNTLMQRNFPFMDIVMPVGISFYTFRQSATALTSIASASCWMWTFWNTSSISASFPCFLQAPSHAQRHSSHSYAATAISMPTCSTWDSSSSSAASSRKTS